VGAMEPTEVVDEAQGDPAAALGRLLLAKEGEVSELREQRVRALEAALQVHPSRPNSPSTPFQRHLPMMSMATLPVRPGGTAGGVTPP
jgi:hypothetical protein